QNPRTKFATDVDAMWDQLILVNKKFLFFLPFDSSLLASAHLYLPLATAALALAAGCRLSARGLEVRWGAPAVVVGLTGCLVLPHLPVLLVGDTAIPWRNLYACPLLFTASLGVGFQLALRWPWLRFVYAGAVALLLVPYVRIARENAADYVKCYRRDLILLRD